MSYSAAYACIVSTPSIPADAEDLKIDEKEIQLFREVLLPQMQLKQNKKGWWLEFFSGSSYVQRFCVTFHPFVEKDEPAPVPRGVLAVLAYVHLHGREANRSLEKACELTSWHVRGSKAVKCDQLYEASTHHGYVDGRGAQYISKIDKPAQFERHVLLHALAYAYLQAMEKLGDRLSEMLPGTPGCEADLRQHYKQVALFNAKSFFHQPVKLINGPTCEAWLRIDEVLGIRTTNEELSRQVQSAHDIYSLDAEKQAALRLHAQEQADKDKAQRDEAHQRRLEASDRRKNWWLGVIAVLVGLASVPGITDLVKSVLQSQ